MEIERGIRSSFSIFRLHHNELTRTGDPIAILTPWNPQPVAWGLRFHIGSARRIRLPGSRQTGHLQPLQLHKGDKADDKCPGGTDFPGTLQALGQ